MQQPRFRAGAMKGGMMNGTRGAMRQAPMAMLPPRYVMQPMHVPLELPDERQLNKIYKHMWKPLVAAAKEVVEFEPDKTEDDIAHKIRKYIWRGVDVEVLKLPWQEAAYEVVQRGMHSYTCAMGDSPWFFKINLAPVFATAAWHLLSYGVDGQRLQFEEIENVVAHAYAESINHTRLDKVLWSAAEMAFDDEKFRSKLFRALSGAHKRALEEVREEMPPTYMTQWRPNPREDEMRVELFVRKWIDGTSTRAWASIESAGLPWTEDFVFSFFQSLISPMGDPSDDDFFCCIPIELAQNPPPLDWPYLAQAVAELHAEWNGAAEPGPKKKRRKTGGGGGGHEEDSGALSWAYQPPVAFVTQPEAKRGSAKKGKKAARTTGHPECTSNEDCIGNPAELKVRHLLDGEPADLYCEACWNSFIETTPSLEGVYED